MTSHFVLKWIREIEKICQLKLKGVPGLSSLSSPIAATPGARCDKHDFSSTAERQKTLQDVVRNAVN